MSDVKVLAIGPTPEIYTRFAIDIPPNNKHGACPVCGGKDRFRCDDKNGRGTWVCSQCEPITGRDTAAGDGFELIRRAFGYQEIKQAFKAVSEMLGIDSTPPSKAERLAYKQRMAGIKKQAYIAEKEAHRIAAAESLAVWNSSTPANDDHPYLMRKKVKAWGISSLAGDLIIPVRINGNITSIQRIKPDGAKRFQKGGEIVGGYHSICGDVPGDWSRIYIAEGYATGATIREATCNHVAVAFNAGNLKPVAQVIRSKLPDIEIVIAADNDRFSKCKSCGKVTAVADPDCQHCHEPHGQINTGVMKANAAAFDVGAKVIVPQFADDESGSDWNDWSVLHG